ncbi:MAG: DNA primase [Holosporaceae bacterium]|jgi:DNA primase|nr:DNA primase [Holosporaceae bacterium]
MDKEFIEFLKSKASIVDVISSRIRLRKSGKDWFGLCPFHKEKTGSLKVDPDKGYYYCFGCGANGDIINFVKDFDKINFVEAVELIANLYGIPVPRKEKNFTAPNKPVLDALTEIKNWFVQQLKEPIGEEIRKYLEMRKISWESMEKFQLGYAPSNNKLLLQHLRKQGFSDEILQKTGAFNRYESGELVNRYNGRLIFPILDGVGKCVGFGGRILYKKDNAAKYINSPETEIFIKSDHLYGYFLAKRGKSRQIVLTEGYLDVISMHQAGFDGAVAPMGTSISETQINMCWNVCNNPVISLDGDSAGLKASYRWIDKILPFLKAGRSFKFARLPQGMDPDELISHDQSSVIEGAIANATPLCDWMWEGAFLLYPAGTPEEKVALIGMLMEKAETIKDVSIKKLYIQTLKQKERDLYFRKNANSAIKKENITPITSIREKIEKIFIVTLLNHPYIIDRVVESFIKLEFTNLLMQTLKGRILECYESYLGGEEKKYVDSIVALKNDFRTDLKNVELHASFAGEKANDDEALDGWFKMIDKYYSEPIIAADLQTAASSLKSTFSESDWQRLKALKQEIISRTER